MIEVTAAIDYEAKKEYKIPQKFTEMDKETKAHLRQKDCRGYQ